MTLPTWDWRVPNPTFPFPSILEPYKKDASVTFHEIPPLIVLSA